MPQFIIRNNEGWLFQVSAAEPEEAYLAYARFLGYPEPIDTGNVDVDLFTIERLKPGTVLSLEEGGVNQDAS